MIKEDRRAMILTKIVFNSEIITNIIYEFTEVLWLYNHYYYLCYWVIGERSSNSILHS